MAGPGGRMSGSEDPSRFDPKTRDNKYGCLTLLTVLIALLLLLSWLDVIWKEKKKGGSIPPPYFFFTLDWYYEDKSLS